jgi:hypothetical protein
MANLVVPGATDERDSSALSFGIILFAGCMMLLMALFHFFQGLAAVTRGSFYAVVPNYAFKVDTTAWGWIQILLSIIVAAAGIYLFMGKLWARIIAIIVALVSAVTNFLSIPYYPVWSLLLLALDLLVIWAIAFHGRELQDVMDS